jgi:hypothetical protein
MRQLNKLMSAKILPKTKQRKLPYKLTMYKLRKMYKILNEELFNNCLPIPILRIKKSYRGAFGHCFGEDWELSRNGSCCEIVLTDRWFSQQWAVIALAHEMVHQYQWDITSKSRVKKGLTPIMSHGPSFVKFRKTFAKKGLPLNRHYSVSKWYQTQNFFKC